MTEKIEIPPGLIRVWKMWLVVMLATIVSSIIGWCGGHSSARIVEKEVRVEVQPPACHDEMIQIETDLKKAACSSSEGVGQLIERHSFGTDRTYLVCTCPRAAGKDGGT